MKYLLIVILFLSLSTISRTFAHEGESHKKENKTEEYDIHSSNETVNHLKVETSNAAINGKDEIVEFDNEFSSLHPLIVHFPIVMLILAVFSQLLTFIVKSKELNWVTLFLLIGGFIGAYLAANSFHPHTSGLSERVQTILETHEYYSYNVVKLTGVVILLKIISMKFAKSLKKLEYLTLILILFNGFLITMSGHYGAKLIHIEGVGAKGNYIENHE